MKGRFLNKARAKSTGLSASARIEIMSNEMKVRFLVNKASRKILYMEAGKDFVDVLLGFLQLPVATILSEFGVGAPGMQVGSISNVYESLRKLSDSSFVVSKASLMNPPSPLRLSIDSPKLLLPAPAPAPAAVATMPDVVYRCDRDSSHDHVSLVSGADCPTCKRHYDKTGTLTTQMNVLNAAMPEPLPAASSSSHSEGYVKDYLTFIVTDNLCIMPSSTIESILLLNKLCVENFSDLDSQEASVTAPEVLELLKVSFTSRSVLNHVFSIHIIPRRIDDE